MFKVYSIGVSWVLLCIWVFYTFFHTGMAIIELNIHHKITTENLKRKKEKKLVNLCISTQDKDFVRVNKKEFIWQEEWYDIDEIIEKNGKYYIIAHLDKKEGKLQKHLANALEQHKEQSEKGKKSVKFEIKESYVQHITYRFLPCFYELEKSTEIYPNLSDVQASLLKPPPEIGSEC